MAEHEESKAKPPSGRDRDWLLAEIVTMTNQGLGFDIVLSANGQTIAGKTISGEAYFEEMARRTELSMSMVPPESWPTIRALAEFYRRFKVLSNKPADAAPDYAMPPPNYIHLENARILGEARDTPSTGGLLWRGRLCEITGFALGAMSRS